jgi:hypothetical protein
MCKNKTKNMKEITVSNPMLITTSLEGFIYRLGVEEGTKKYEIHHKNKIDSSLRTLSGWMKKGYSEEEAKIKLSKHQSTFSLEKCIEKYGLEKGSEIHKKRQEKWIRTLNNKSEEELDAILRSKISNRKGIVRSKSENELFESLSSIFSDVKDQFILKNNDNKRFVYDIKYKNKIIEFNGTYWHCDPRFFDENFFRKDSKLYAKDIWKKDLRKINLAKENGFEVLVIWEYDYKNHKNQEIEKCIDFLRND